jgi:hypothetical protein
MNTLVEKLEKLKSAVLNNSNLWTDKTVVELFNTSIAQAKNVEKIVDKWNDLDNKIGECYGEVDDELNELCEDEEGLCDLCSIGEIAAIAFGYL